MGPLITQHQTKIQVILLETLELMMIRLIIRLMIRLTIQVMAMVIGVAFKSIKKPKEIIDKKVIKEINGNLKQVRKVKRNKIK